MDKLEKRCKVCAITIESGIYCTKTCEKEDKKIQLRDREFQRQIAEYCGESKVHLYKEHIYMRSLKL